MIGTSQCSSFAISNKVSIPSIKLSLPSSLIISSALVVLKSSYLIASSNLAAGVIDAILKVSTTHFYTLSRKKVPSELIIRKPSISVRHF